MSASGRLTPGGFPLATKTAITQEIAHVALRKRVADCGDRYKHSKRVGVNARKLQAFVPRRTLFVDRINVARETGRRLIEAADLLEH